MSLDLATLEPWFRPFAEWFVGYWREVEPSARVTSARRSTVKQRELWERWQRGGPENRPPRLYKPARPGTSKHERGLAFDLVLPGHLQPAAGNLWRRMNGVWRPADPVHFESP